MLSVLMDVCWSKCCSVQENALDENSHLKNHVEGRHSKKNSYTDRSPRPRQKPIRDREFSPSGSLKCFPQFGTHRIPMNGAVSFSFILIIMTSKSHDPFHSTSFLNMNNFFWIVQCIRRNFELRRTSVLDAGLLHLCRARFTCFCN